MRAVGVSMTRMLIGEATWGMVRQTTLSPAILLDETCTVAASLPPLCSITI